MSVPKVYEQNTLIFGFEQSLRVDFISLSGHRISQPTTTPKLLSKEKEKGICQELPSRDDDVISSLPDSLISHMLSCLPTKEAVRTSVLSTRWKSLWLSVPSLRLASHDFPDYNSFVSFVDKSIDLYREENSCLHKLELVIRKENDNDQSCVTRWIDFVSTRKVNHLDLECILVKREFLEAVPLSLYLCESLLYLRLHRVSLSGSESVSLPRLKTMCLEQNVYADEAFLESFISSCPVLEDLSIVRRDDDNVKVLRVHSQTLTSLTLGFEPGDGHMLFHYFDREILGLFIDSPRLKHLNFNDDVSKCHILSNFIMSPSVKVNLGGVRYMSYYSDGVAFSNQHVARSFFTRVSRVKDLVISETIMKLIDFCMKVEPLPQFRDLSCLEAKVCLVDVELLPKLLESFPNLNSIVLDLTRPTIITEQITVWDVPQCLLLSLEFVEIKCCCKAEVVGMKLAEYFAENSVFLKKLVLRWRGYVLDEDSVLRDLLALSWRSTTCQIEVCGPLNKTCR
ncbi:FBD-associated F-box protein At5g44490-like isoform X1 [Raphanus sativus]|uniref:FBD-associated F-box protein At5g44490-like isoform X1 n=1 Tax=Raphanus sativus TaxID=3726 RepID=A0A9W3D448_RAPSA|nr:FBD-associated F-box protein At5g44490-like isoform X1 [Raphanus sativus]